MELWLDGKAVMFVLHNLSVFVNSIFLVVLIFLLKALPKMKQKKALSEGLEVEPLSRWFMVSDVMMFDNIGVSNAVGDIKYLTCADCEMGPVGWTDLSNKKCYIALARVRET